VKDRLISPVFAQKKLNAASAAQDPYTMAGKAVEIGYDVLNGKKPEQALTLVPVDLITKENVAQYKGWTK
jgi:ribose transport system substrate-binding protein